MRLLSAYIAGLMFLLLGPLARASQAAVQRANPVQLPEPQSFVIIGLGLLLIGMVGSRALKKIRN